MLGWLVLDQTLSIAQIAGMITVLASVWLGQRAQQGNTPIASASR
jgi:probable blue pigment (indigoidine) exporter